MAQVRVDLFVSDHSMISYHLCDIVHRRLHEIIERLPANHRILTCGAPCVGCGRGRMGVFSSKDRGQKKGRLRPTAQHAQRRTAFVPICHAMGRSDDLKVAPSHRSTKSGSVQRPAGAQFNSKNHTENHTENSAKTALNSAGKR